MKKIYLTVVLALAVGCQTTKNILPQNRGLTEKEIVIDYADYLPRKSMIKRYKIITKLRPNKKAYSVISKIKFKTTPNAYIGLKI